VLSATLGRATQQPVLKVRAPRPDTLSLDPPVVPGGGFVVGRITLTGPAAAAGTKVTLTSGDPGLAGVPAYIGVPQGAKEAVFAITTQAVEAAVQVPIAASSGGVSRTAVLTILPTPASPATFTVSVIPDQVMGGKGAQGAIALTGPAPAGGLVLTLSTDHGMLVTLPDQVLVPPGASAVTFPIQTRAVTAPTSVSISAKAGSETETAALKLLP